MFMNYQPSVQQESFYCDLVPQGPPNSDTIHCAKVDYLLLVVPIPIINNYGVTDSETIKENTSGTGI